MRKTTLYSMLLTGFVLFGCSATNNQLMRQTNSNTNTNINTTKSGKRLMKQKKQKKLL